MRSRSSRSETVRLRNGRTLLHDHPVIPQLKDLFGEHTFLLDSHGLNIVEPAESAGSAAQSAKVVNVASWTDDSRSGLELHEPETTDVVITLGSKH